ncbi:hypothetical protein AVEN_98469-1 [Araneus ventricosus]|uniref:Uncharacterized protein n=1 Tax=Araneus ventricosus TaxID=182803 RepID=A0A4Y2NQK0_ARAVE|nr:hypothetical protein AVEN_98469-1 [Araneus ventricosus]
MEVPCKRHNWSLQSPRATVPSSHPAFPERACLPLPHFVVFAFVREARTTLPTIVLHFYGLMHRMKIQTFRAHRSNSHQILALTTGFGTTGSNWCGTEHS